MKLKNGRYEVYGNPITEAQTRATDKWQAMLAKKFNYDPNEKYNLSVKEHPYGGGIFGLKDIVRWGWGTAQKRERRYRQHHPHGLWALPHRDGGRFGSEGDGFPALLARPAFRPWHHH